MRKICIINEKGGVGKTTTAIALATGLAKQGKKILLVDMDPQGNVSSSLHVDKSRKDMFHILVENAEPEECIQKHSENLYILPGRETLTKAELILVGEKGRELILQKKLKRLSKFDYILIDCAPSLGLLNQNVMLYADEAIVPVSCDYLGVEAILKMVTAIASINDVFEHALTVTKIVPTMYDGRLKICRDSLMKLQNEFYEKVTPPIRMNSKLKEAPQAKQSIFDFNKSSNGAKDYATVVQSVIQDEKTQTASTQAYEPEVKKLPA